ncbi:Aspartic protease 1 [Aphelenchoides bicaudatus]|nr:Aspartic protease 1 [Aphelenchoides bicaudatus]
MKSCFLLLAFVGFCAATEVDTVTQPLSLLGDFLTTSVGIGSPPQYFDLFLDTSDDKLVIADTQTSNPGLDYQYNYIKNLFVPESSNTLNQSQNICRRGYRDGTSVSRIDGIYATDLITIGGNTFQKEVRFCELNHPRSASDISSDPNRWFQNMPIDGFLGLRPGGEDILQKIGLERQISFIINSGEPTEPDAAGLITFGGQDTKNCKSFRTFPSNDFDTWRAWISQTTFNGKTSVGVYSTRFEFHNKTLIVPKDVYNQIVLYFGNQVSNIPCSSYKNIPDLTLSIYGRDYAYPISRIFKQSGSSTYYCKIDIDSSDDSSDDQIVLNRYLFDKYCLYLDFDDGIIGLADVNSSK